jgi:hypothetical protein
VIQSARFLLAPDEAQAIVRDMQDCVRSQWQIVDRAANVSVKDCRTISSAFENEGFLFKKAGG